MGILAENERQKIDFFPYFADRNIERNDGSKNLGKIWAEKFHLDTLVVPLFP